MDNTINSIFANAAIPAGLLKTNLYEYENRYEMSVEVPGVPKEQLTVEMDNDKLSIFAEINKQVPAEEKHVTPLCERMHGKFRRNYRLPNVDATQIVASYKDGVLYLTLPKMVTKQSANIQIM